MELKISEQIQSYRKNLGLTQEQLAEHMGVTNQAVSKWETDQSYPDIQLLPELADLFGITLDQLFGREEAAQSTPVSAELPWEDDGNLRAVVFVGRTLADQNRMDQTSGKVELHFQGSVRDIHSEFAVFCEGSQVQGSVTAGDEVACGDVYGSVNAGDSVSCGNVGGNVNAGDSVSCGNIGGDVNAGDIVSCHQFSGNAQADGSVQILR